MAEIENIQGRKIPVPGGGTCIYCGSDGGVDGLRDEHAMPFYEVVTGVEGKPVAITHRRSPKIPRIISL